jgi:hypothetical protein
MGSKAIMAKSKSASQKKMGVGHRREFLQNSVAVGTVVMFSENMSGSLLTSQVLLDRVKEQ